MNLKALNIGNLSGFKVSDIFRLLYLSSFVRDENILMETERTALNKQSLKLKMRLSKSEFNRFYSFLTENILLSERKGRLILDSNIAKFGEIKDKPKEDRYIKIYIENIRYLYSIANPRDHKRISMLYKLIPYLHTKYNIVCSNIYETERDSIKRLKIKELSAIFKYNELSFRRLIQYLGTLKDKDNIPILQVIDGSIVISPKVMYGSYTAYNLDEWIKLNDLFGIDIL